MVDSQFHDQFKSLIEIIEKFKGVIGEHTCLIHLKFRKISNTINPEDSNTYTANQLKLARATAKQKYLAILFLRLLDRARYRDLVDGLINNHFLGLDTFPKTL